MVVAKTLNQNTQDTLENQRQESRLKKKIADPTNTFRTPEDIYNLLADIIDPTCEIYWTDTSDRKADKDYVSGGYYSCSHCSHELPVHAAEAWDDYQANDYEDEAPFECCPHCGAQIVVKI